MSSNQSNAQKNRNWLQHYYPNLPLDSYDAYLDNSANISTVDVLLAGGTKIPNYLNWCISSVKDQLSSPDQFLTPRFVSDECISSLQDVSSVIDSESRQLLDFLLSVGHDHVISNNPKPSKATTLLVFGSHAFLGLVNMELDSNQVSHVILVEGNIDDFACSSAWLNIEEAIISLKNKEIGFTSIFTDSSEEARAAIEALICHQLPTILYGIKILKSPIPSTFFASIESWFNSSFGIAAYVPYYLGNETDEINQSLNALISHSKYPLARDVIRGYSTQCLNNAVVITASGPSLDGNISRLRQISLDGGTIIASGSSLGTLLRNDIYPDYVVFLEMSSQVYRDILELVVDGLKFPNITAVLSVSVDPRIPALFDKYICFQRPQLNTLSLFPAEASSCLIQSGPQVVNAALEFALSMGARKFILMGCDFSAPSRTLLRSGKAIGESFRDLNVPHRGLYGKTVYSSSDLLITANAFSQALIAFDAIAFTTSNIVDVGSQAIKLVESYDNIHICPSIEFNKNVSQLCKSYSLAQHTAITKDMIRKIASMPDNVSEINKTILEILGNSTSWNWNISREISRFIAFPQLNSDFDYEIKLYRSLYFFLIHPLYLADSSDEWNHQLALLANRFDLLEAFSHALSKTYSKVSAIGEKLTLDPESNRFILSEMLSSVDS